MRQPIVKLLIALLLLINIGRPAPVMAQAGFFSSDSLTPVPHSHRVALVTTTGVVLYTGSMVALYQFWYKDYAQSRFHFIDDNHEWMQMDKVGHSFTAYYEGIYGYNMLRWAGVPQKKAALYGASWGFMLQTPIEILDGFSSGWGFSWGDMAANTSGALLAMAQEYYWDEQKIQFKFSFTPSPYPAMLSKDHRGLLGKTIPEQLIKDYNGQTYWLSFGLNELLPKTKLPPWLNLAVGYGADGMLRGTYADQANDPAVSSTVRQRQFYLSLDLNWQKLPVKSPFWRTIFTMVSFVKVPAPALNYNTHDRWHFYFLYF